MMKCPEDVTGFPKNNWFVWQVVVFDAAKHGLLYTDVCVCIDVKGSLLSLCIEVNGFTNDSMPLKDSSKIDIALIRRWTECPEDVTGFPKNNWFVWQVVVFDAANSILCGFAKLMLHFSARAVVPIFHPAIASLAHLSAESLPSSGPSAWYPPSYLVSSTAALFIPHIVSAENSQSFCWWRHWETPGIPWSFCGKITIKLNSHCRS